MYLENMDLINYGAIEKLSYRLPFNDDGTPQPLVLIGKNGVGKTLLIASVVQALIEMKRKHFTELQEVTGDNYYKLGSKKYIRNGSNYLYINYSFTDNYYVDLALKNYEQFKNQQYNIDSHKYVEIDNEKLKENGFFWKISEIKEEEFSNNIFLYFPVDRYYLPNWLNPENENVKFNVGYANILGRANFDIIRDNIIENIESWILDVVIDKLIYEGKLYRQEHTNDNGEHIITEKYFYEGKNATIQNCINNIVSQIFKKSYRSVRIGISSKGARQISFMCENQDGEEEEIIPDLKNISSGEMMIFAIFCSILKEYDRVTTFQSIDLKEITGIVLIDEIDLHLHSDFSKEILPRIMAMFPKIQFIVSSHSPFFLLGMNQYFGDKCKFLSLPDGTVMNNIYDFEEIKKCYEALDKNSEDMIKRIKEYEQKLKELNTPLIITEGKTDWKHLKNALNKFKANGEFLDLDIQFEEYNFDMGDSKLETLLNNLAKIKQTQKIIGIFDNDSAIGEKYLTVKKLGSNVWCFSIPKSEEYDCGISIEMLYKRAELQQISDGRRIYMSDEFNKLNKRLKTNTNISTNQYNAVKDFYSRGIVKIIDSDVFDAEENSLALSKEDFARKILNGEAPFDDMNINNFKEIFENIQSILNE